jgi:hypothetical protein
MAQAFNEPNAIVREHQALQASWAAPLQSVDDVKQEAMKMIARLRKAKWH